MIYCCVFFDVNIIEINFSGFDISSIDALHEKLKKIEIDSRLKFEGFEGSTNKLSCIKKYYENIEAELKKEKYEELYSVLKKFLLFSKIHNFFAVCEFWDNIDVHMKNNDEFGQSFSEHFLYNSSQTFRKEIFNNPIALINALSEFRKFWGVIGDSDKINFLSLELNIFKEIVCRYESEKSWFEGKEKDVLKCLEDLKGLAHESYRENEGYDKDIFLEIEIYFQKFKRYCFVSQ